MMLLAFSNTGTSRIEVIVRIAETVAESRQWSFTGATNLV